jgi:uncharacterized membrane protein
MFKRNSLLELIILAIPFLDVFSSIFFVVLGDDVFYYGLFRIAYIFLIFIYLMINGRLTKSASTIYIFLGFLFILLPLSTNYFVTYQEYIKLTASLLMYPVGYWFVNSKRRFNKIAFVYVISAIILIVIFIFLQIFQIGKPAYHQVNSSVLLLGGSRGIYVANLLAYSGILILYLMTNNKEAKFHWLYKYILLLSLVIVIIIFRRSALIALVFGIIVFLFFTKRKYAYTKYIVGIMILLIIASPFYFPHLEKMYQVRNFQGTYSGEHAGRVSDVMHAYSSVTNSGIPYIIIGSTNPFNYSRSHNVGRRMQDDYAVLFYSSGLIGLSLFFLIFAYIWYAAYKKQKILRRTYKKQDLLGLMTALIIASLIVSLANQLWVVTSFSYIMLLLGSIQGYMSFLNKKELNISNRSDFL